MFLGQHGLINVVGGEFTMAWAGVVKAAGSGSICPWVVYDTPLEGVQLFSALAFKERTAQTGLGEL